MAALIDGTFGSLDAAAETIYARTGRPVSKGTLSKRLAGHCGWPADEIWALEDAAGRHPVSRMRTRQLKPNEVTAGGCIMAQAGKIFKETGEAVDAIFAAQQSASAEDWAKASKEIQEAEEVLARSRAYAESMMAAAVSSGHSSS
ncbi:hypothetical protein [Leisingera sp. M523]|uniref:hypothetical protein n=1 Tax=Leisingera sp. M523 TaxID=2867013 RepID=UPI0021A7258D|nr:hypothetical protein [Leisingera sp. M523]UWQ30226.1 hypothetical protein K3557_06735 [Leisingera sp. M523]